MFAAWGILALLAMTLPAALAWFPFPQGVDYRSFPHADIGLDDYFKLDWSGSFYMSTREEDGAQLVATFLVNKANGSTYDAWWVFVPSRGRWDTTHVISNDGACSQTNYLLECGSWSPSGDRQWLYNYQNCFKVSPGPRLDPWRVLNGLTIDTNAGSEYASLLVQNSTDNHIIVHYLFLDKDGHVRPPDNVFRPCKSSSWTVNNISVATPLSAGAISGIVLAVLLSVALAGAAFYYFYWRPRRQMQFELVVGDQPEDVVLARTLR